MEEQSALTSDNSDLYLNSNFKKFVFLLNEDSSPLTPNNEEENFMEKLMNIEPHSSVTLIKKIQKMLKDKIRSHTGIEAESFNPDDILETSPPTLAPVLYRISIEGFAKLSKSIFKIIECPNATKLASDWKPTLPDFLIDSGHQVIIVELKEGFGSYYNDFTYSILRQIHYDWKLHIPRSFFHPADVCEVKKMPGQEVIIITPSLPDGELEFSQVKSQLQHDILTMFKNSCLSSIQNHLLLRDLRVGKFNDALDGLECVRYIYRSLQERLASGDDIFKGSKFEDSQLYLETTAGPSISSASIILSECDSIDPIEPNFNYEDKSSEEEEDVRDEEEGGDEIVEIKKVSSFNFLLSRESSESTLQVEE